MNNYCGPTTESNWVIPGVLLVGAYPASEDDTETFELITSILKLGIRKFVCLQLEYRADVTPEMWRYGKSLRPYFEDVKAIVANKANYPQLANSAVPVVDAQDLSFEHCPIVDCGITDDERVLALSRGLVEDIAEGEVLYLHCWGGHGRTGTVVSIMLHLMYGMSAAEAMARCQLVHDLRVCPVNVGSPQTQTQRDQVMRIVGGLEAQYRLDRMRLQIHTVSTDSSESAKQPLLTSRSEGSRTDDATPRTIGAAGSSSGKIRTGSFLNVISDSVSGAGASTKLLTNGARNSPQPSVPRNGASAQTQLTISGPSINLIPGHSTAGRTNALQDVVVERGPAGPPSSSFTSIALSSPPPLQPAGSSTPVRLGGSSKKQISVGGGTTPTLRYAQSFASDNSIATVTAAPSNVSSPQQASGPNFALRGAAHLRHLADSNSRNNSSNFDLSRENSFGLRASPTSPANPLLRSVSSDYGFGLYEQNALENLNFNVNSSSSAPSVHLVANDSSDGSCHMLVDTPSSYRAVVVQTSTQQNSAGDTADESARNSIVMAIAEEEVEATAGRPMSISLEGGIAGSEIDSGGTASRFTPAPPQQSAQDRLQESLKSNGEDYFDVQVRRAAGTSSSTAQAAYGGGAASGSANGSTISQVLSVARQVLLRSGNNSASNSNNPSPMRPTNITPTAAAGSSRIKVPTPPTGGGPSAKSSSQQLGRKLESGGAASGGK